jgi:hypothetical protein
MVMVGGIRGVGTGWSRDYERLCKNPKNFLPCCAAIPLAGRLLH